MTPLVIYYSYEGNTAAMAEAIAEAVGAETLRLTPVDEPRYRGFMKFVWGGKQVFTKKRPELKPFDCDIASHDLVFVGTPVWAGGPAPAMRTFLDACDLRGKHVALFCCHGGGPGKTFKVMRSALADCDVAGEIAFLEPLKRGPKEASTRAVEWARVLVSP